MIHEVFKTAGCHSQNNPRIEKLKILDRIYTKKGFISMLAQRVWFNQIQHELSVITCRR
jgi:hypothetical protein